MMWRLVVVAAGLSHGPVRHVPKQPAVWGEQGHEVIATHHHRSAGRFTKWELTLKTAVLMLKSSWHHSPVIWECWKMWTRGYLCISPHFKMPVSVNYIITCNLLSLASGGGGRATDSLSHLIIWLSHMADTGLNFTPAPMCISLYFTAQMLFTLIQFLPSVDNVIIHDLPNASQ